MEAVQAMLYTQFCSVLAEGPLAEKLKGLKFKDFFSWLSRSVSAISQSMAGENVELEPTSDWGSLD